MKEFKLNRYEVDLNKVTHYNADLQIETLSGLIRRTAERYPDRPSFGEKRDGEYRWMTYGDFYEEMLRMRTLLKERGLGRGDRMAVIANNSVAFAQAVYAAYGLGGIVVPMYEVQSVEDWRFIFGDARPRVAVVRNENIAGRIRELEIDGLETILVIDTDSQARLAELARACEPMDGALDCARPGDVCDIMYTSGTTGRPRGVELTHKNIVHNVKISAAMFDYGCNDRVLSFLPWAHGFGKTVDFSLFVALGAAVGLAESPKTIAANLLEVNPTVLCAVPKIFNRIYEQIHLKLEASSVKRLVFERAQKIMHLARTQKMNPLQKLEYRLMDKKVASLVRGVFGNSLKFCVSGGASLSREVGTFFEDFGVRVFEGYGMTEHSPVISINYNPDKIGSVGVPLPTVKVEVEPFEGGCDDDKAGEIVITSDCVMKGYHNDPAATAAVIDERGRLHTGDTGFIDDEGFIYITGRVKDQYKLANGKYVVPAALEEKICSAPEIDCAVMFGAGRPYNVVLIHPSEQCMNKFYASHAMKDAPRGDVESHPGLRSVISEALQRTCADFRGYERPQKFFVSLEEFTIQNGLLTPALKIKRRAVESHFVDVIDALYRSDD